jgi:hypothetical protein
MLYTIIAELPGFEESDTSARLQKCCTQKRTYMRKSTIIAHCLVNSNMISSITDAEHRVRTVFEDEFPNRDFARWNGDVDDAVATDIIRNVGRASRINVKNFIEDLSR